MTAPEAHGWDELRVGVAEALRPLIRAVAADAMFTTKERDDYLLRKTDSILKLIEAARLNRGGDEGEAGVRRDNAQAGEGEAPVAWANFKRDWDMITANSKRDLLARGLSVSEYSQPLYTRPAPATPEGLREKIIAAIYDNIEITSRASLMGADKAADAILAAIQPQAQGGE